MSPGPSAPLAPEPTQPLDSAVRAAPGSPLPTPRVPRGLVQGGDQPGSICWWGQLSWGSVAMEEEWRNEVSTRLSHLAASRAAGSLKPVKAMMRRARAPPDPSVTFACAPSPHCSGHLAKVFSKQEADTNIGLSSKTGGFGWGIILGLEGLECVQVGRSPMCCRGRGQRSRCGWESQGQQGPELPVLSRPQHPQGLDQRPRPGQQVPGLCWVLWTVLRPRMEPLGAAALLGGHRSWSLSPVP